MASDTLERLGIDDLNVEQRLELIGEIWDSITEIQPDAPIPGWHIDELKRRRDAAEANPEAGIPWEEVRSRLMESE